MREFFSMVLIATVAVAGMPLATLAAQEPTRLAGTAYQTNLQPLAGAEVQVRSLHTGRQVASTVSSQTGEFAFVNLAPGSYVVEIVDGSGRLLGMTGPLTLATAGKLNISVVAVSAGAVSTGEGAGFSLFGLGPVTSLAVIGAAGAAAVTAVVATRQDASPSR